MKTSGSFTLRLSEHGSPGVRCSASSRFATTVHLAGPFDAWLRTPALGSLLERVGGGLRALTVMLPSAREVSILVLAAAWRAPFE